ncbi:hypothetical protein SOVF_010150 [Spinacia oleracea]|nr:hypothetical protein SOVF_010150 [Spinacia oleracea]
MKPHTRGIFNVAQQNSLLVKFISCILKGSFGLRHRQLQTHNYESLKTSMKNPSH